MNKALKYLFVIVAVILVSGLGYYYVDKTLTANAIRNERMQEIRYDDYIEWLAENCVCIEKKFYHCAEDFELKGETCLSSDGKFFSRRLISCSKYDCSGDVRNFNFNETKWDVLEDFKN
jgi:hypothetical protein